ncbi:MAG: DMT family transporter [Candidatus Diapherotrites archaeon]|nr:DMT family transporter [Candidatus Diapherotrites archaeon]
MKNVFENIQKNGLFLVLLTSIISGFSIFINKYAVLQIDSYILVFLRALIVSAFLFALILLFKEYQNIKKLSFSSWLNLILVGLVGGSIPFVIYFYALKNTSPINSGFIHKTLFIWASILAYVFLKEKPKKNFLFASFLILLGNFLLFSQFSSFNYYDLLIFVAVLLWAAENTLSKKILNTTNISGTTLAFGRMFFGSIFLSIILAYMGKLKFENFILSDIQISWLFITSFLLFLYNFTFYNGLKNIELHKATAILMLGQPITTFLSVVFSNTKITFIQALGNFLILLGVLLILFASIVLQNMFNKDSFSVFSKTNLTLQTRQGKND